MSRQTKRRAKQKLSVKMPVLERLRAMELAKALVWELAAEE